MLVGCLPSNKFKFDINILAVLKSPVNQIMGFWKRLFDIKKNLKIQGHVYIASNNMFGIN